MVKTVKKLNKASKVYVVTLAVKNGPFETKDAAEQARVALYNRGVPISALSKTSKGFSFVSKLGYRCANTDLKNKLISRLNAKARASKISKTMYRITTRKA